MNRKLGRLLEPGLDLFFVMMLIFSVAALAAGVWELALTELVATGALYTYYQYHYYQYYFLVILTIPESLFSRLQNRDFHES